jgi:predicted AAA+ superfamily ATPase
MYSRLQPPFAENKSVFLFGPRGTGKSQWLRTTYPGAPYFDLLDHEVYRELLASPSTLGKRLPPKHKGVVIIDEVQRVPEILDEVHRLIETRKLTFILTGSSARKLKRGGVNLLAGRALTRRMHPLTAEELGDDFRLARSLRHGQLPAAYVEDDAQGFLDAYVSTYLREEVMQEGLTRNLSAFTRFLETASFSQAQVLNITAVAREAAVDRKLAESYVGILEDLMLARRLPAFTKRAKRRVVQHPKFFYFDAGVFRTLRPKGPLDSPSEIDGPALETLVLEELSAHNDYANLGYALHYYRTATGHEVDFVLYGERGLLGIEVKRTARLRPDDFKGIEAFRADYPNAKTFMLYGGDREYYEGETRVIPVADFLPRVRTFLMEGSK